MPTLRWSDIVPIATDDAKQAQLSKLDDQGFSTTSWQEGSNSLLQVELSADLISQTADIAVFFKSAYMPNAPECRGDTLTRTSSGFFNNQRATAQEAQHLVTLSCIATQGPYTINQSDLVIGYVSADRSVQCTFRNIDGNSVVYPVTLNSGGAVTLLFEAETAGSQANVGTDLTNTGANTTMTLVTTLAGVTITSHSLYQSGTDEERDDRLKLRNSLRWADNGQLQSSDDRVRSLLLSLFPTIQSVAVDSTNPRGAGTFDVYVAGLDDTASDTDVLNAQLQVDLLTFGRNNTPKTAMVKKCPIVEVDLAGVVYFTGSDAATVQTAVEAALVEFLRTVPPGGMSYLPGASNIVAKNDLETVIKNAVVSVADAKCTVVLTTPASDITVLTFGKVIRGDWNGIVYQALQT